MPLGSSLGARHARLPLRGQLTQTEVPGKQLRMWRECGRVYDDPGKPSRAFGEPSGGPGDLRSFAGVFASHGSDPDLSDRILHQLLGADLLFVYGPLTAAR